MDTSSGPQVVELAPPPSDPSLLHQAGVLLSSAPVGLLSSVLGPGHYKPTDPSVAPPQGVEQYIPGIATGMYGGVHSVGQVLDALSGGRVGWSLPGGDRANELTGMDMDIANRTVPHVEPTPGSAPEAYEQAIGQGAGGGIIGVPGSHLIRAAAIGGALGAGSEALERHFEAQQQQQPSNADQPTVVQLGAPSPVVSRDDLIQAASNEHGVPVPAIQAVIKNESHGDPRAVSETGNQGLMQIGPDVIKKYGVTDPFNEAQNINAGTAYLREGMDATGTVQGMARYYHGGPDRSKWGPIGEQYAQNVANDYAQLSQAPGGGPTTIDLAPIPNEGILDKLTTIGGMAAAVVGGALVVRNAGAAGNFMRGLVGVTRDTIYNAEADRFNVQNAARLAGAVPPSEPLKAAPIPGQTAFTPIQAAVQDRSAPIAKYIDATAATPDLAERLRNTTGLTNNNIALMSRIGDFQETGYDPVFGMRMPSEVDHTNKVMALSPDEFKLYNEGRQAADELDTRLAITKKMLTDPAFAGTTVEDANVRHNFFDVHSDDLRQMVADAQANPVVKALLDESTAMTNRYLEIGEAHGLWPASERVQMMNTHPNYAASTDFNHMILHPFGDRDYTVNGGIRVMVPNIRDVDAQHSTAFMKMVYQNDANAAVVDHIYRSQADMSTRAPLLEPSVGPPQGMSPGDWVQAARTQRIIGVRRGGELQWHRVNNPDVYQWFQNEVGTSGTVMKGLNMAKNLLQSFTTGPAALLAGHPFSMALFARNILTSAAIRPADMPTGIFDAMVHKASGGRFGLPGDVPGVALGSTYAFGADAMASLAKFVGKAMHQDSSAVANRVLRTVLGDANVDGMSSRAFTAYANSSLAEQRMLGARGGAGYGAKELPTNYEGALGRKVYTPMQGLVNHDLTSIPFMHGAQQLWFHVSDLASELHELLSGASQSSAFRLSKGQLPGLGWLKSGLDDQAIVARVRDLQGDPGKRGGSPLMRNLTDVVPYLNIAVQDNARLMKGLHDNPMGTLMGLTTSLGMGAAASLFTAMLNGPDALLHAENQLSSGQRSDGIILYPPRGQPVLNYTTIPLSQRERVAYPFIHQLMGDGIHAFQAYTSPDSWSTALEALTQFLGKHITNNTRDATLAGVSSAWSPPVPGPVGAFANLMGRSLDPTIENLVSPNHSMMPIHERLSMPLGGGQMETPNALKDADSISNTVGGNVAKNVMASVLGVSGAFLVKLYDILGVDLARGNSGADMLDHVIENWKQNFVDETRVANLLWNSEARLSKGTPLSEVVANKLAAIRLMTSWKEDLEGQFQTRRGGPLLDRVPGSEKVPTDPMLRQMWITSGVVGEKIEKAVMPTIHDLDKQIDANERSGMSPQVIRHTHNQLVAQRDAQLGVVATFLQGLDDQLSQLAGKKVQVDHINWHGTASQFQ